MNILSRSLILLLGLSFSTFPALAAPDWQTQINYQGQLATPAGLAVADGSYNITFKVYNDPSSLLAGNLIWGGETQSVAVSKGLFNVYLGQVAALPPLTPAQMAGDFYLFVQVAGEASEMLPRQKLLPAFFARSAFNLQGLYPNNTANNLVVLDGAGKIPAGLVGSGSLSVPLSVTNECASCYAAIFTNVTATGATSGAALRIAGRLAAPDIVNTFIASAGVTSQVVVCPYCKAGDEVFLQAKGNWGNTIRYWITSVSDGSFSIGFSTGLSTAVSMAYLVIGDF